MINLSPRFRKADREGTRSFLRCRADCFGANYITATHSGGGSCAFNKRCGSDVVVEYNGDVYPYAKNVLLLP